MRENTIYVICISINCRPLSIGFCTHTSEEEQVGGNVRLPILAQMPMSLKDLFMVNCLVFSKKLFVTVRILIIAVAIVVFPVLQLFWVVLKNRLLRSSLVSNINIPLFPLLNYGACYILIKTNSNAMDLYGRFVIWMLGIWSSDLSVRQVL